MTVVSIIVPAYNEEKYLPTALGSLVFSAMGLPEMDPPASTELIVVDNGSSDRTAEVAASFGAHVVGEVSRGVARARNAGANQATGELLVFVDADYRVPFDLLPAIVCAFRETGSLSAAGVKVRLEPNEIDPITRAIAAFALSSLRRIKRMSFGVFVFRRSYFQQIGGFNENCYAYEDVEVLERIGRDGRAGIAHYEILTQQLVRASARGFYRGGMLPAYVKMAVSRKSRGDFSQCGYWYDR